MTEMTEEELRRCIPYIERLGVTLDQARAIDKEVQEAKRALKMLQEGYGWPEIRSGQPVAEAVAEKARRLQQTEANAHRTQHIGPFPNEGPDRGPRQYQRHEQPSHVPASMSVGRLGLICAYMERGNSFKAASDMATFAGERN